jgi:hypothetical protein
VQLLLLHCGLGTGTPLLLLQLLNAPMSVAAAHQQ